MVLNDTIVMAACTDYFHKAIVSSIFRDLLLSTFQNHLMFLLKELIVTALVSSTTRKLLLEICSAADML